MSKKALPPTVTDVARKAEVSIATVSRVLNDSGPISPDIRSRVERTIREIGYVRRRPKIQPAGLNMLPILVPDTMNPYFSLIVQGIQDAAEARELFPIIINISDNVEHQRSVVQNLRRQSLNGMIVCSAELTADEWISFCEDTETRLVIIHNRVDHPQIASIAVDFETAANRITHHLLDLNHSRFAYVSSSPNTEYSDMRIRGIQTALYRKQLTLQPELALASDPSLESAYRTVNQLYSQPDIKAPTALIVYNDYFAVVALHALRALGLRVPEDVSVASFDDIPMAAHTNPPLTTADVPKYRIGRLAMQLLTQLREENAQPGGFTMVEAPITMRQSTGPAPTSTLRKA